MGSLSYQQVVSDFFHKQYDRYDMHCYRPVKISLAPKNWQLLNFSANVLIPKALRTVAYHQAAFWATGTYPGSGGLVFLGRGRFRILEDLSLTCSEYRKECISPFCYISSKKYIVCVIITDVYQVSESYIPRKGGFQRLENRGYMHARCPLLGHGIPELITRLANCGCGRSVSWWHLESRFAAERLSHWLGWLAEKYSISWKISRLKWLK